LFPLSPLFSSLRRRAASVDILAALSYVDALAILPGATLKALIRETSRRIDCRIG
jgi:hypothetical protein